VAYLDANRYQGDTIRADVAIIGAGAAGIAVARELANSSIQTALIEAGDFAPRRRNQSLYLGENTGRTNISPAFSRFRAFGGSTTRWGGQCRPLDPIDFAARAGISESGWPFGLIHLEPYYRRAQTFCRLGPFAYDPGEWSDASGGPIPFQSDLLQTRVYQFSHPTDLGVVYREELGAHNVTVYLNANLTEILSNADATRVTGLRLTTGNRRTVQVEAGTYVLACGGIENARLLLASDRVRPGGLGNDHDLVGRYFMDHPYVFPGYYRPARSDLDRSFYVIEGYDQVGSEQKMHAAFSLSDRVIREEGLNGGSMYLVRRPRYKAVAPYWSPGGRALNHLIEVVQQREHSDGRFGQDAVNLMRDLPNVCRTAWDRLRGSLHRDNVLAMRVALEATPCRDSRVTLGRRTDRLGMRRVEVHWRLNEADKRGYERLLQVMRSEFQRLGLGSFVEHGLYEADGWPSGMIGGKHHMGTTRMHPDPRHGVVDPDCRVHGLANLYVAGSSVFPTGGYANPTLTISALAIRLADLLKARFKHPEG
jgi:choline dehydrogenase-like flavoprotein